MKERIEKERIHLFSPYAVMITHVEMVGVVFEEKLREAVKNAVRKNEILNARVVIEEDGSAYYETQKFDENPNETLRVLRNVYWKDIVKEQEKIAFDLDHGELLRIYYLINEEKQELLIIGHCLAGDAVSHAYFIEDIMKGMADIQVTAKPIQLCRAGKLPKESALSLGDRMQLKGISHNWKKEGIGFSEEEYYQLHTISWKEKETLIQYETFHKDALYRIAAFAQKQQVTVNSVILTAFAKASRELRSVAKSEGEQKTSSGLKPDHIVLELCMRDAYQGMGDYAYPFDIAYLYDENLDFAQNVQKLHTKIHLNNPKEVYERTQWFSALPGTLVDSVYFELQERYVNPVTEAVMQRFGISARPKGMAVTNLVKVPIAPRYGGLTLKNYVYVAPLVPYARRVLGITMFQGTMNISFHVIKDSYLSNAKLFFQKGIACLREL